MKVCTNCQYEANDNEVYCVKCGALLPQAAPEAEQPTPEAAQPTPEAPQAPQAPHNAPYAYPMPQQPVEEVSTGKWILYHLIPCIPVVGGLIFIVMLFVWAFGTDKNATFRNWAKSQLIFMAASVVISILLIVLLLVLGHTVFDVVNEMTMY